MRNLVLTALVSVGLSNAALAGSPDPLPTTPPVIVAAPVAGTDWSGFYAGGLVSFDSGGIETFLNDVFGAALPLEATTAYGGFIGYNQQVNASVFGAELAYTAGDVATEVSAISYYSDRIDLKARVGYSFGRTMVYGVAGYSWADFPSGAPVYSSSGLNYGVGVDAMIGSHLFIGAEYLMRDLSGRLGVIRIDGSLGSTAIRIGYKF